MHICKFINIAQVSNEKSNQKLSEDIERRK